MNGFIHAVLSGKKKIVFKSQLPRESSTVKFKSTVWLEPLFLGKRGHVRRARWKRVEMKLWELTEYETLMQVYMFQIFHSFIEAFKLAAHKEMNNYYYI